MLKYIKINSGDIKLGSFPTEKVNSRDVAIDFEKIFNKSNRLWKVDQNETGL